jgi:hypothetical protein
VLERWFTVAAEPPDRAVGQYAVRHLERLPLGTPYTSVAEQLVRLFAQAPLTDSTLVIDSTGVGRPVVDWLRKSNIQAALQPLTITGGYQANREADGGWRVPKKELVSVLQVLLQARRLKVAPTLAEAGTLVRELQNFQVKITTAAHETFGTWREGLHDDLVLAVAVAAWQAERESSAVSGLPFVFDSRRPLRPGRAPGTPM